MLRRTHHRESSRRRGTVAAVVAVSLPVLIGVAALGLDSGVLFIQKRQAQTMAEAVSTAAAYQLYLNSSNTSGATAAATALAVDIWRDPHGEYSPDVRGVRQQDRLRSGLDHNQLSPAIQCDLGGGIDVGQCQRGRWLEIDTLFHRRHPRAESVDHRGDTLGHDVTHRQ